MKENRVCAALGIEKPVIQGAMAFVSTADLAAAVSNAGGLGVLGLGYAPEPMIRQEIAKIKTLTDKKYALQVDMTSPRISELDKYISEYDIPVVYGCGMQDWPQEIVTEYTTKWHQEHRKVIFKASTVADAVIAEKAGGDVIAVKGWEGGGHISFESTMVLAAKAKSVITAPLVVSGGIANGDTAAAAIALGADGIEMGTVFLATAQAAIHPNAKKALLAAGDMSTVETNYSIGPTRELKNELTKRTVALEQGTSFTEAAKKLKNADSITINKGLVHGDTENGAIMCGQDVSLINEQKAVTEIIDGVLAGAQERIKEMQNFSWE
ncbi:nitronate monooxygenase [Lactobacillus sp. ESL0679]|uniref:NAD(P)H-dependent flavin oxidoreductase n=1 Tax=Lactobacillus sp. ESL0679 TaxID=2983209 RepID=UPI0023F8DF15|nr:nitronate monooxygenase [Lactobacillus sp. ESL0679]MDF7683026.1 nitronate monooxygenase [Lactobacillus sp. ESL0679]